jgi:hypothetical protein
MERGAESYDDILFPQYYEDIFCEEDLRFRFRLIRNHIHPKLRVMLAACLDTVSDVFETDPLTFSRMRKEPKAFDPNDRKMRCALYGLQPKEVRGKGFPNLTSSSGGVRTAAEFDLSFFAEASGLGIELRIARRAELKLLDKVYTKYRDQVDALLTCVRLGVDSPLDAGLMSLRTVVDRVRDADNPWVAVFEPRYQFPISARDYMPRFEDCFLALYLIYDAMVSHALGIDDKFEQHFEVLEERYSTPHNVDEEGNEGGEFEL